MLKTRLTLASFDSAGDSSSDIMATYASAIGRRRQRSNWLSRTLVAMLALAAAGIACVPIAYMLWPQPKAIAPDAPSLPITIGGVVFNVPPAAIRVKMQRRPGQQARVDLSFVWPSLTPPDATARPAANAASGAVDRMFVTITATDGTMPPGERLTFIYPRYADHGVVGPDGLMLHSFRNGSPYQGEDLILEPAEPERFLLRCTRPNGGTPPMCLHERRIGGADVTVRFPREWLSDWHAVAAGVDRLLTALRPTH
jgi:hypothetical protein